LAVERQSRQAGRLASSDRPRKGKSTADKMKTVKAAWDKAPAGPKKDAALKHYQAAEKAQTAKNDSECNRELDAASTLSPERHDTPLRPDLAGEAAYRRSGPS
jgi:hypothetical protein